MVQPTANSQQGTSGLAGCYDRAATGNTRRYASGRLTVGWIKNAMQSNKTRQQSTTISENVPSVLKMSKVTPRAFSSSQKP